MTLTDEALTAFINSRNALANFTKLTYLRDDNTTNLSLTTDVTSEAIGAVLHQHSEKQTTPISFFSVKFTSTPPKYSTFSRELLAIYLSIKHFRHILEGRNFTVFTDHRPLVFALHTKSDRYNPRDYRQLDFISQFTTDIRHIAGNDNIVADTLSRASLHSTTEEKLDMEILADEQVRDVTLFNSLQDSSLKIEQKPLPFSAKLTQALPTPHLWYPSCEGRFSIIFTHFHTPVAKLRQK